MNSDRCADPRIPAPEACVLGRLLERWAEVTPDKVFALYADGTSWTYAQTLRTVRQTAAAFAALGVRQGDNVLSWLPNGPDAIRVWFALNYLGAVYVPINVSYRGRLLEHLIANAGAELLVVHPGLVERLEGIGHGNLKRLVVLDDVPRGPSTLDILGRESFSKRFSAC